MTKKNTKKWNGTTCPPGRWAGGANRNVICKLLGIGGGDQNTIQANFATISGGQQNLASGNFSAILGGNNNVATGANSAILGGANNNDGGNANTGIYGNGVLGLPLAAGNGGFFVNELVIQNIPVIVSPVAYLTLQPGQIYTDIAPGTGYLQSRLFIR